MPNEKGWYTKEEANETGLPRYNPTTRKWSHEPYERAALLTRTRCKELKMPALKLENEFPSAFRYNPKSGYGSTDKTHKYIPLYDRTGVFEAGELPWSTLYDGEKMGDIPNETTAD